MDWPKELVTKRSGKSYVELFRPNAEDSRKIFQQHLRMSLQDQIVVRGEGEDGDALVCCKSYLVQISTHFQSFVERWNHDKTASIPETKLKEIPLGVFKNLVELASTGLCEMDGHSDLSTLVGEASSLGMADLSDRFSALLRTQIKKWNRSVIMWSYVTPKEFHNYDGLIEEASKFIKSKLEYILASCSDQLMELSGEQWLDLLSDPALFVVSEDVLFQTIYRWVAVVPSKRSDDFVAMTKFIRGGCLSKNLLAEFWDGPSTLPAFAGLKISGSAESQPRTMEVVAFSPYNGEGGMLCFDPFARSAESVSRNNKFSGRVCCLDPLTNIIYMFGGFYEVVGALDPILDSWKQEDEDAFVYGFYTGSGLECASAYLDGSIYLAQRSSNDGLKFCQLDCSDISSSRFNGLEVPDYVRCFGSFALIGLAGKIHVFTKNSRFTYDVSNKAWSPGSPVTPPFPKFPESCCIGPDGIIYIQVKGETRLWIFNAATSDFRISAACTATLRKVLNVENRIICPVATKTKNKVVMRVYDQVSDSDRHETTVNASDKGDFLAVRLPAASFNLLPRNSTKRHLED